MKRLTLLAMVLATLAGCGVRHECEQKTGDGICTGNGAANGAVPD